MPIVSLSNPSYIPYIGGTNLLINLVSWWELGEATGSRADSHGSNTLTDNNGVTQAVGKVGNAAQFTQVNNEYLSVADTPSLDVGTASFTWCGWVYHDTVTGGDTSQIYAQKDDVVSPVRSYLLGYGLTDTTPNNRWFFSCGNNGGAGADVLTFSSGPSINTWYFMIYWRDVSGSPTINLQVNNGTPESVAHTVANIDNTVGFSLGGLEATLNMDGRMDQAGFWTRVLTAEERTWLYNSGNGRAYAELG